MAKSSVLIGFVASLLFVSLIAYSLPAFAQGPDSIPGQYIVVLEDGVSPQDVIKKHGAAPEFVYTHALNGFAAPLSPAALADIKQDSRVKYVEQNHKLSLYAQSIPTGIDRIDAEPGTSTSSYAGQVTVAIIDTGIASHSDLNVVKKVNCANGGPFTQNCSEGTANDAHGHGTHVAGTVAAIDNAQGVVGVAPGADLWAMKVFKDSGTGYVSYSIAALDYIVAQGGVDVINMSVGSSKNQAYNDAVANAVDAGIVVAVAAGNDSIDAKDKSPASEPKAITVSAIADFDGQGGGGSDQTIHYTTCSEYTDDSVACFSNFGSIIDIAAPGVLILSTYNDGGYATMSGTSMASPHVAGAAAKIIGDARIAGEPIPTNEEVENKLIVIDSIKSGEADYFTIEDPDDFDDGIAEPLLYVGNEIVPDVISPVITVVTPSATSNSATITWTTDEPATSVVDYGIDNTYGDSVSDSAYVTDHSLTINGLTSETSYHFKVTSVDPSGNSASSGDNQFVTTSPATLLSISVTPVNPSITVGSTQQFIATGTYSDDTTEDLTQDVIWTSSTGAATIDANGLATGVSEGQTTIKAEINDLLQDSTVLDVTPVPITPTDVFVSTITYDVEGGKSGDKHLAVFITLVDNLGDPVSGAEVTSSLYFGDKNRYLGSASGNTDGNGIVKFIKSNAQSGTYTSIVTSVVASGLTWDNVTPTNSYTK